MAIREQDAQHEVTLSSDAFKRAELRLEEWAAERARITSKLRVPVLSSMSVMVDYLRREEEPERVIPSSAPKKPKRKEPKAPKYRARQCRNQECRRIYAAAVCPNCGQPPLDLTARGTASTSAVDEPPLGFSQTVAQIDGIVEKLPGRYKTAIFRYYMYRQPDRIAARELDMPREKFTDMRERAVILVAEKLAQRREAAV